jgi:hypothetical protein
MVFLLAGQVPRLAGIAEVSTGLVMVIAPVLAAAITLAALIEHLSRRLVGKANFFAFHQSVGQNV